MLTNDRTIRARGLTNRLCAWFRELYAEDKELDVDPVIWVAALRLAHETSELNLSSMASNFAGRKMGFADIQEALDYIHDQVHTIMISMDYEMVDGVATPKWETATWNADEEENLWTMFSSVIGLRQEITECPEHLKHIE